MIDNTPFPANKEVEQAIIGSCIIDPAAYSIASPLIYEEYFYTPWHQALWGTIDTIYTRNEKPDQILILEFLKAQKLLDVNLNDIYIRELIDQAEPANIATHAAILKEFYNLRRLKEISLFLQQLMTGISRFPMPRISTNKNKITSF